jgi:glycerol-3-phosphate dehydrogenase
VVGVRLRDEANHGSPVKRTVDVYGRVVINATGAWADRLREDVGIPPRIRPLRGSHLIFPAWRLPVAQAVSFLHPVDRRPVFIFPWEGITLVGTTDVDHDQPLDKEPSISPEEVAYLMAAVEAQFPSLRLTLDDVLSTFAGVRPVIGTGKVDPSKESRDHVVWEENGLLTVTGGKLTTFRLIALDALKAVRHRLPELPPIDDKVPVLNQVDVDLPGTGHLDEAVRRRLLGRYGTDAPALVATAKPGELEPVSGTQTLWAELRWGARAEGGVRLDDLLLRRLRLGLLLPRGGEALLGRIQELVQPELGWTKARWMEEASRYRALIERAYQPPR